MESICAYVRSCKNDYYNLLNTDRSRLIVIDPGRNKWIRKVEAIAIIIFNEFDKLCVAIHVATKRQKFVVRIIKNGTNEYEGLLKESVIMNHIRAMKFLTMQQQKNSKVDIYFCVNGNADFHRVLFEKEVSDKTMKFLIDLHSFNYDNKASFYDYTKDLEGAAQIDHYKNACRILLECTSNSKIGIIFDKFVFFHFDACKKVSAEESMKLYKKNCMAEVCAIISCIKNFLTKDKWGSNYALSKFFDVILIGSRCYTENTKESGFTIKKYFILKLYYFMKDEDCLAILKILIEQKGWSLKDIESCYFKDGTKVKTNQYLISKGVKEADVDYDQL